MKRSIVLVGLPGSGKTTAGTEVARLVSAPFLDVDSRIEESEGMSISEIFAKKGEPFFRHREQQLVLAALQSQPCVISPGSGWVEGSPGIRGLADEVFSVYLKTSVKTAIERLRGDTSRPLLKDELEEGTAQIFERRNEFYVMSEATVDTDGVTVGAVAGAVAELARSLAGW